MLFREKLPIENDKDGFVSKWQGPHPKFSPHTHEEFKLYSYKVDRLTEKILPQIVDDYNHCIDAIRYGLVKKIQQKTSYWNI